MHGVEDQSGGGNVEEPTEISSPKEAADNALVLAFGRLQGAANRLEYILGRPRRLPGTRPGPGPGTRR